MIALQDHPVFDALRPELRFLVAGWVEDLVRESAHLYAIPEQPLDPILDAFLDRLFSLEDDLPDLLSGEDWEQVEDWANDTPREILLRMIAQACIRHNTARERTERVHRRATPEQLKIVAEAQQEVGLNFSRLFNDLTSWEADAIIKGILVISEVQRLTGDRHFKPRDLRQAIREYVIKPATSVPPAAQSSPPPHPRPPRRPRPPEDEMAPARVRSWPATSSASLNYPVEDTGY